MKALTIKYPWIEWVLLGHKTLLVQSKRTLHTGQIILCTHSKYDEAAMVGEDVWKEWPFGKATMVATLKSCSPMEEEDYNMAMTSCRRGAYVWEVGDVEMLPEQFPVEDHVGLFELSVPENVLVPM